MFSLPGFPKLGQTDWHCLDLIEPEQLDRLRDAYRLAYPFPHLVLNGLFDPDMLRAISAEFDAMPEQDWRRSRHRLQDKQGTVPDYDMPAVSRAYFENLHDGPMARFLSAVTQIDGLEGDPSLENGGLHQVPEGGRFDLHVDFARHPRIPLKTRIVVITYLNEDWVAEWGGSLELWQWRPRLPGPSIEPLFGRTLIMEVGPRNVHGLPAPVCAPDGRSRRSVTAYYYTPITAGDHVDDRVTGYVDRPNASLGQRLTMLAASMLPRQAAAVARWLVRQRRTP